MPELTPETIRALRQRLGLTQAGLAERLGCTTQAVAFWEQGRRSPTGLYAREVRRLLAETETTDPPGTISPLPPDSPASS
jgi:DNA-binding transcriptional regulator YiaG